MPRVVDELVENVVRIEAIGKRGWRFRTPWKIWARKLFATALEGYFAFDLKHPLQVSYRVVRNGSDMAVTLTLESNPLQAELAECLLEYLSSDDVDDLLMEFSD